MISGQLNLFRNLLQGGLFTFVHVCSIGGAPGVGAFNGLATNVTTLQTDFPTRGLNGTAVNVRTAAASCLYVLGKLSITMLICAITQESTLPLDAACDPVHAWRFNQANTIFQVCSIISGLTPATVVLQRNFTILGAQLDIDSMSHTV